MATETYTLEAFVNDLRTITSETTDPDTIIVRLNPLAERLALDKSWLKPEHYNCDAEQGFSTHLLHEEEDHTLAVFAIFMVAGARCPAS